MLVCEYIIRDKMGSSLISFTLTRRLRQTYNKHYLQNDHFITLSHISCHAIRLRMWRQFPEKTPMQRWNDRSHSSAGCVKPVSLYGLLITLISPSCWLRHMARLMPITGWGTLTPGTAILASPQSLWAQLRGEVLWAKWQHYTKLQGALCKTCHMPAGASDSFLCASAFTSTCFYV